MCLYVNGNQAGAHGISLLCDALGGGCCPALQQLHINANKTLARGVAALVGK